jgi:hypothetical protein
VSRAADRSASVAVILDERSHFGTSQPAMMKSLLTAVKHLYVNLPARRTVRRKSDSVQSESAAIMD